MFAQTAMFEQKARGSFRPSQEEIETARQQSARRKSACHGLVLRIDGERADDFMVKLLYMESSHFRKFVNSKFEHHAVNQLFRQLPLIEVRNLQSSPFLA
jgi:hypothetical protein